MAFQYELVNVLWSSYRPTVQMTEEGSSYNEHELLLAPGTKFRLVQAYFNDGEKGQERKINFGNKKSWKIYLETVPDNDAGNESGGGIDD